MFFDGWQDVGRVLLVGSIAYAALVVFVRAGGKRTLAKMNAFDLVVTVALGSVLATVLLSKDVALVEGLTAMGLLVVLQFAVAWSCVRSSRIERLVKAEPRLLVSQGRLLQGAMKEERVTADEVMAAARRHGAGSLDEVTALVLETDGGFSVVTGSGSGLLGSVREDAGAG